MIPGKTRSIHRLLSRCASAVTACVLATGVLAGAAIPVSASDEVHEYAEAAKQAARALDQAKAEATKSAEELDQVSAKKKAVAEKLSAAESARQAAESQLEEARAISTEQATRAEAARAEARSLEREEGIVDVAAEVAGVASGETDNVVVSVATGAVKAGLTGVVGPVLSLLDPLHDAVQGHIDQAEQAYEQAAQREQAMYTERMKAVGQHRAAATAFAAADKKLRAAQSALKNAKQAEGEAAEKQEEDAKAAKSAKAKAEDAKAAEKKAKQKAKEKAARSSERAAAAGSESRSASPSDRVMPGTGGITSQYGMRTHPITGVHKLHSGTDFGYGDGTAYAAASGTVAEVTHDGAYGNMVTLSHGGGVQTRYAHLASASVSVGQRVSAGSAVGRIGSTGMSTGPHLHFEVLVGGDFVNPQSWLSG